MSIDIEIFQEHARKNLFMIQQNNYYRNLHQFFDWVSNSRWGFKKSPFSEALKTRVSLNLQKKSN
jgi:hypothetical protein